MGSLALYRGYYAMCDHWILKSRIIAGFLTEVNHVLFLFDGKYLYNHGSRF
ncbi:MAG: hypothetical protein ACI9NY_000308 [Kiritimatiellia bacterium]|jgi:hypothetical protein